MSASSLTPNTRLPQFDESDKPTWLGDFNTAMMKIDAAFTEKDAQINQLTAQLNAQTTRITALAAATGHSDI